jgi:hypothetical protein
VAGGSGQRGNAISVANARRISGWKNNDVVAAGISGKTSGSGMKTIAWHRRRGIADGDSGQRWRQTRHRGGVALASAAALASSRQHA